MEASRKLKYFILAVIVLATLLCGFIFGRVAWRHNELSSSLERARACIEAGDATKALEHLNNVMRSDPVNVEALLMLEEIALDRNEIESVAGIRLRLIKLEPMDEKHVYEYCVAANDAGDYKAVLAALNAKMKERKLTDGEAIEQGIAWLRSGKPDDISALHGKIASMPDNERRTRFMADYALSKNDIKKALGLYSGLSENAASVYVRTDALVCLARMSKESKQTEGYLRKATELYPQKGFVDYGEFLLTMDRSKELLSEYDKHFELLQHSLSSGMLAAEAALMLEDKVRLATLVEQMGGGNRNAVALKHYFQAMTCFLEKDYAKAYEHIEGCADFRGRLPCMYMEYVSLAAASPAKQRFSGLYLDLLKRRPMTREMLARIADIGIAALIEKKNYSEAKKMLQLVDMNAKPSDNREDWLLTCMKMTKANDKERRQVVDKILSKRPDNVPALEESARLYMASREPLKSMAQLERLWKLNGKSMNVFMNLATMYDKGKRGSEAEALCRDAMGNPELRRVAHIFLTVLMLKEKRQAEVEKMIGALLSSGKDEDVMIGTHLKAFMLESAGDYANAAVEYKKLTGTEDKAPSLYLKLAHIALQLGNSKEQEQWYRDGLAAFPDSDELKAQLASLLSIKGRETEAVVLFEEALAKNDKNVLLLINYSECAAGMGKKEEAMRSAMKAKVLMPSSPAVSECYAMRLFDNGRYNECLVEIGNYLAAYKKLPTRLAECQAKAEEEFKKSEAAARAAKEGKSAGKAEEVK